jgi:hypothetical protein
VLVEALNAGFALRIKTNYFEKASRDNKYLAMQIRSACFGSGWVL